MILHSMELISGKTNDSQRPIVTHGFKCVSVYSESKWRIYAFSELFNVQNAFATGALPWWYLQRSLVPL